MCVIHSAEEVFTEQKRAEEKCTKIVLFLWQISLGPATRPASRQHLLGAIPATLMFYITQN